MDSKQRRIAAFVIFGLLLTLAAFLYRPILLPFLWALILGTGLNPLFQWLARKTGRRSLSSLLICLLVLGFLLVPVWQFLKVIDLESSRFANRIDRILSSETAQSTGLPDKIKTIEERINLRTSRVGIEVNFLELFRNALVAVSRKLADLPAFMKKASLFLLDLFFFFVILFFLMRFGRELAGYFKELLPVDPGRTDLFFRKFREMAAVSLLSSGVIALTQGTAGFIIYLILGVEEPFLWAVLTGLCSFIPVIGASAAWISLTIIFLLSGLWVKALLLFILGAGIISTTDNIIRPLVIHGRSNIHPVLLFFSIICGLRTMGFIGIFAGPLITVLALTAIGIYHETLQRQTPAGQLPASKYSVTKKNGRIELLLAALLRRIRRPDAKTGRKPQGPRKTGGRG